MTNAYSVVAEHPRPRDCRPSVWEVAGPDRERCLAKQHAGPKLLQCEVDACAPLSPPRDESLTADAEPTVRGEW